jgi:PIN domain nuclease of toxin-antitoxin system
LKNEVVFDASVLLAILQQERGVGRALEVAERAVISAVNLAEVQTKLVEKGNDTRVALQLIQSTDCTSIPFEDIQAAVAGSLVAVTRRYGLSLGDRACLALALVRKAPVYTTDRVWSQLDLDLKVEVIR